MREVMRAWALNWKRCNSDSECPAFDDAEQRYLRDRARICRKEAITARNTARRHANQARICKMNEDGGFVS
jgi:hypothetical protein